MEYYEQRNGNNETKKPLSTIFLLVLFTALGVIIVALLIALGAMISKLKTANHKHYYGIPIIKPKRLVINNNNSSASRSSYAHQAGTLFAGFFSPASPIQDHIPNHNITQYQMRIRHDFSVQFGLNVKWSTHSFEKDGYLAGNDSDRASDVNELFADKSVQLMIANRGGWGCNRILDLIDYDLIKRNPKIFMGYSDLTGCLNAIFFSTGIITFHGPMGLDPFEDYWPGLNYNLNSYYMKQLLIDNEQMLFKNPPLNGTTTIKSGKAKGRLIGGNLTVFASMIGSKYLPPNSKLNIPWEDIILFFEDVNESSMNMDRLLQFLAFNGILDKIAGFIYGTCQSCEPSTSTQSIEWVVRNHVTKCPAFMGSRIGHEGQQFTLPIGGRVEIDADAGTIQLLEKVLE